MCTQPISIVSIMPNSVKKVLFLISNYTLKTRKEIKVHVQVYRTVKNKLNELMNNKTN